ncbi:FAD-binding oxidoreductase [Peterkaempfera bronchialis]|uniref:FAD-binding oxidoreductase n=1 Tax=Peterkaempfera bronchialis TaxID=2126346 RepID=UPI003C2F4821
MTQDGQMNGTSDAAARILRDAFTGAVHLPGDQPWDTARLAWMRGVDSRPAIVAEAAGPEDVRAGVLAAREHGLPFAVQSTGHGAVLPSDGGLLLTTSRMAEVTVDPGSRTARVGPGAVWADVIAAAAPHGLAPLSGTPSIGATGFTLGGGIGWLSRRYGFAADSLLSADLVTADGRLVTATADDHPDLHWALRGGSGNFGVVTSMEVRLHPVARVHAGMALYPVGRAREVLACYREWAQEEPDELSTALLLMRMPPFPGVPEPLRGKQFLALRACFAGSSEEAERHLKPLRDAAGQPVVDSIGPMEFARSGAAITGPPPPPMVARQQIDLFRTLPDEMLETIVEAAGEGADSPLMSSVEIRHWGGAMARPDADAGPAGHRDVPFSVITTAMVGTPEQQVTVDAWVDGLTDRLRPHATGGTFLNFLTDPARTRSAFTAANWARLVEVKRTWDGDNFFRLNHNIPPN